MRILIVEDEARLANFVRKGLKESGYTADVAGDAENADYLASVNDYDLILLDWVLPDRSGLELCKSWRSQEKQTPIIMVTARDDKEDIISGLDCGADDYIVKPFSFSELLARIRALLRRSSTTPPNPRLKLDDLEVDFYRHEVMRGGEKIFLSMREFSLLEFLLRNSGKAVTKTEIFEHVWGQSIETNTNIIEVTINHLRKKLDCGSQRPLIHTIRGVGYMIKEMEVA